MLILTIPAISCGHCARAITEAMLELDPGAHVEVDIDHKRAAIDTRLDPAVVRARLSEEGYPPEPA